ncbi:MAG: hypothetical protein ACRDNS_16950 [Trebonia sp.]
MKRLLILGAAVLSVSACAGGVSSAGGSGTTPAGSGRGDTLTIGDVTGIGSFDPARANAGTDPTFLDPIYAPLFRVEPDGQIGGVLATSWGYLGSGNKVFRMKLRPGVSFSNGTPVTATAVVV